MGEDQPPRGIVYKTEQIVQYLDDVMGEYQSCDVFVSLCAVLSDLTYQCLFFTRQDSKQQYEDRYGVGFKEETTYLP